MDKADRLPAILVLANEPMQQLLAATFGSTRSRLVMAADLPAARAAAMQELPALVLLVDSAQPRLSWAETASALRTLPTLATVPFIALGPESESEAGRLALRVGVDAYYRLPFQPFKLLMTVQDLLARALFAVFLAAVGATGLSLATGGAEYKLAGLADYCLGSATRAWLYGMLGKPV